MRVHPGLVPPKGWQVSIDTVVIQGETLAELVKNYIAHVRHNAKGDVNPIALEAEVHRKLVERWPQGNIDPK